MKLPIKLAVLITLGILCAVLMAIFLINPLLDSYLPNSDNLTLNVLYKILALFIFIILPFSLLVWLILLKLVVKPIKSMSEITKIIALGDLGKRIDIFSHDEFAELGENINIMIHNLTVAFQSMANSLRGEKEKEKQLQSSYALVEKERAKDEALLGSMNEGVVAISRSGGIILFNQAAAILTGVAAKEVINLPYTWVLKFVSEKDDTPVPDFIKSALSGEAVSFKNHLSLVRKDGQRIPIAPSIGMIHASDNQIQGVVVVLKDISELRQLDKTKDEFISIASHELRTPMTAIKGLISMIFEGDYGKFTDELKDPLQDVAVSVDRLIQLVNDMLDVSRIEVGKFKFSLADKPVYQLADEILELLKPLTDQKGIKLELESNTDSILTDPDKFKQIVSNLVGNSIKFTDQGKISISFKRQGDLLNILVTDTGIGISKADQKKLFTKFAQITTTQTGRPKGTGLGLFISREFAKKLGGDLWIISSEPGKGSVFAFSVVISNSLSAQKVKDSLKSYLI